jgi:VIT1/CCC1 family predicted Fe2+/Mn2+ transporter
VVFQQGRVLDPIERVSEVLFGLIMVLTFTGSLSVATAERHEVREMLIGAIGCNLAWGIVDAVMYVMSSVVARARALRTLKKVQTAVDPAEARDAIASVLSAFAVARLRPEILEMARQDLTAIKDAPLRAPFTRDDWVGAVEVFLLVFLSTFPVVVPFIVMSDATAALRMSNWIAIAMLFIGGWSLGHYAGLRRWAMGLSMAALGAVLVGITIALGG